MLIKLVNTHACYKCLAFLTKIDNQITQVSYYEILENYTCRLSFKIISRYNSRCVSRSSICETEGIVCAKVKFVLRRLMY